jgi:hypothetical protein
MLNLISLLFTNIFLKYKTYKQNKQRKTIKEYFEEIGPPKNEEEKELRKMTEKLFSPSNDEDDGPFGIQL